MLIKLFQLLSNLPLPVLHAAGVAFGWLVYLASPSYRKRLNANIELAGFGRFRNAAVAESGKNLLELPFIWCAKPSRVLSTVTIENWELIESELAEGRGLIFLTPHLGCFEISAQAAAQHIPMTVLYRPPRKALLRPLMERARARENLALAPANLAGVRMLLKALKKGQAIGLLPDQVPQQGEGVWADFFRKPAYTMTLPAKLAQMSGAPVISAYAQRMPRGAGFIIRFVKVDLESAASPAEQARAINSAMEQLIARCPAQYFWSYNRYKTPAGAAEATESEGDA